MARTKQTAWPRFKWRLFVSWKNRIMSMGRLNITDERGKFTYTYGRFIEFLSKNQNNIPFSPSSMKLQCIGEISNLNLKPFLEEYLNSPPKYGIRFHEHKFQSKLLKKLFSCESESTTPLTLDQVNILEEELVFDLWFKYLDPFTARNLALTCKKYYNAIFQTTIKKNYLIDGVRTVREMIRFNIPNLKVRVLKRDRDVTITSFVDSSEEESEEESDEESEEESEEEDLKPAKKTKLNH